MVPRVLRGHFRRIGSQYFLCFEGDLLCRGSHASAVLLQPLKDEVDLEMVKSYSMVFEQSFLSKRSSGLRVDEDSNGEIIYPVEHGVRYNHLLCFLPGMIALGETYYNSQLDYVEDGSVESDYALSLAKNMTNGCWKTYLEMRVAGPDPLDCSRAEVSP